ncbi:MAG: hypothetical protein AB7V36_04770 [Bacteroidales bacterium]|jgi:hypothetical protein|nr:hypothetical protein [Bacteroidales bacterium]
MSLFIKILAAVFLILGFNITDAQITEKEFFNMQKNGEYACAWITCVNDSTFEYNSDTIEFKRFYDVEEDTCCYMIKWNLYSFLSQLMVDYTIRCNTWSEMNYMAKEEIELITEKSSTFILIYRDGVLSEKFIVLSYKPAKNKKSEHDRLVLVKIII